MTDHTPHDGIAMPRGLMEAALASRAWLAARGVCVAPGHPWQIDIVFAAADRNRTDRVAAGARFELHLSDRGWGYLFCCGDHVTEIELTDVPSIRIRDPHRLHAATPPLASI